MPDEIVQQNTLRDTLAANIEAAEAGVLETPEQVRARDEAGRFTRQEKEEKVEKVVEAKPIETPQATQPALQRPTTWKKDYLPIWDKLATGQVLTPEEAKKLAEYSNQRENEYKTGVSTYKAEAMQAKELQEAVTPFVPELQARGIKPADWVKQLGQANYVLMRGSPQQKLQMFQWIAQTYGVPLAAIQQAQQGQVPPVVTQLLQTIDGLRNEISSIKGQVTGVTDFKQQIEMKVLENEVMRLAGNPDKYPHFEAVREPMAQLLESGLAPDLDTAYEQATYMVPEVRQQLLTAAQQPKPGQVAAQARARAVSPKSSTPSGQVKTGEAKDRRSMIAEQLEAASGGRV